MASRAGLSAGRAVPGWAPTPRSAADELEGAPRLPTGDGERYTGYGVLGVGFASGHVLAMRRMTASSVGPAFTTVWHREPSGRWTFYGDADPDQTCARYFGPAGRAVRDDGIRVTWRGPTSFSVVVPTAGIAWAVHLAPTFRGRAMAALRRGIPASVRRRPDVQRTMALAGARLLGVAHLASEGATPSGNRFRLDAHQFWLVDASTARCRGDHLGPLVSLSEAVRVGDFRIPAWGVFTTGDAFFEPGEETR
jgi:hypothetical protein